MSDYQREFRELGMRLMDRLGREDWEDIHKRLVHWDLELTASGDTGMSEVLRMQKQDAGRQFARFVTDRYGDWLADIDRCDGHEDPLLAPKVMAESVRPLLDEGKKTLMVVIDNFRYDQWRPSARCSRRTGRFNPERMHWSFLPTATQYARNALFAGMTPARIAQVYPQWWKDEQAKGSKNAHEAELLGAQLDRWGFTGQWGYHKITDVAAGRKLVEDFHQIRDRDFTAVVFNFVDMLSHARHGERDHQGTRRGRSGLPVPHGELVRAQPPTGTPPSGRRCRVRAGPDHRPRYRPGDRPGQGPGGEGRDGQSRYKTGRNLRHDDDVFAVSDPEAFGLPKAHLSSRYIFAMERDFMVYPNNLNRFVRYPDGTFQHGGISMEEMLVPRPHFRSAMSRAASPHLGFPPLRPERAGCRGGRATGRAPGLGEVIALRPRWAPARRRWSPLWPIITVRRMPPRAPRLPCARATRCPAEDPGAGSSGTLDLYRIRHEDELVDLGWMS